MREEGWSAAHALSAPGTDRSARVVVRAAEEHLFSAWFADELDAQLI
jgi:hypothetical protein